MQLPYMALCLYVWKIRIVAAADDDTRFSSSNLHLTMATVRQGNCGRLLQDLRCSSEKVTKTPLPHASSVLSHACGDASRQMQIQQVSHSHSDDLLIFLSPTPTTAMWPATYNSWAAVRCSDVQLGSCERERQVKEQLGHAPRYAHEACNNITKLDSANLLSTNVLTCK